MSEDPASAPEASHYFSPTAPQESRVTWLPVTLAGRDVEVASAPGVFSQGHLDLGTRVLLREVPDLPVDGPFLDLGCGWGPLALTMALRRPTAPVWAVDVNERALDLVTRSAERLHLDGVRAVLPDAVLPDLDFTAIWSNPPIRIGKAALHDLLLRWLPRLAPGGRAHLVVQRNLGADSLLTWLQRQDWPLTSRKLSSAKGFRVIQVDAPD